jgi:hypothetical protein
VSRNYYDRATVLAIATAGAGCTCTSHLDALQDALNLAMDAALAQVHADGVQPPTRLAASATAPQQAPVGGAFLAEVVGGAKDGKEVVMVDGDDAAFLIAGDLDGSVSVHYTLPRVEFIGRLRRLLAEYDRRCLVDGCDLPSLHSWLDVDPDGRLVHVGERPVGGGSGGA